MNFAVVCNTHDTDIMHITNVGINSIGLALQHGGSVKYFNVYNDDTAGSIVGGSFDMVIMSITNIEKCANIMAILHSNGIPVVGFTDGVSRRLEHIQWRFRVMYLDTLRKAKIVMANSDDNKSYYDLFCNSNKVHSIGTPVNIDFIENNFADDTGTVCENFIWQGYISEGRILHTLMGQVAMAQSLGMKSLFTAEAAGLEGYIEGALASMGFADVKVMPAVLPKEFISSTIKLCSAAWYFPQMPSLGRTPAECAVIGMPCFGCDNYFQRALFPDLTASNIYDLPAMMNALQDEEMQKRRTLYARTMVESYEPSIWYKKFEEIISNG